MNRPGASILLPSTWPSTSHQTSWLGWDTQPATSCPTHCILKSLDRNLRCETHHVVLRNRSDWLDFNTWTLLLPPAGCIHGLVDGFREWGSDVGPSLCFPGLHYAGTPLGLQPHLWYGGRGHHPPQLPLPQTHRLFCTPRKYCRIISEDSHWRDWAFYSLRDFS